MNEVDEVVGDYLKRAVDIIYKFEWVNEIPTLVTETAKMIQAEEHFRAKYVDCPHCGSLYNELQPHSCSK